ncbi:MAG: helix-turn-helix transcriptional regulator [Candidatus Onthovivens sp.]|nr:helix-turn-helix transcriptional regulator [Candidatus Onthovivens sp.]
MDQVKTGNLIAKKRRELCLTQKDLAEKLFISDRAVSKWENGRSFPNSSLILKLCEILQISVYELLKGEENLNNNDANQELMLEFIKEKEKKDKLLLSLEIVIGIFSTLFVLNAVAIISLIEMETYLKVIILVSSIIILIVGALFAIRIEQKAGYYECRHCKEHFEPVYSATFLAPHLMRSRLLKCPKCGKITLCKKVIKK